MDGRTKRRGRPRKEFDGDEAAQKRRERLRRAQHNFRIRKQADARADNTEQRITNLECIIEKMSLEHAKVMEILLGSQAVCRDASVIPHLQRSLQSFRDLARNANGEEERNTSVPPDSEIYLSKKATIRIALPALAIVRPRFNRTRFDTGWNVTSFLARADDAALAMLQRMSQLQTDPISQTALCSTNWVSLGTRPIGSGREPFTRLHLLHKLLGNAYQVVLERGSPWFEIMQRTFNSNSHVSSSGDLSFVIRWRLGTGTGDAVNLEFLTSKLDTSWDLASHLVMQHVDSTPDLGEWELDASQSKFCYEDYVSAFQVDDYLRCLGASNFTPYTFSIPQSLLPLGSIHEQTCTPSFDPIEVARTAGAKAGGGLALFSMMNFDSFFPNVRSYAPPPSDLNTSSMSFHAPNITPSQPNGNYTINIEKFLTELGYGTVCLGRGPALIRASILPAIIAGVVA
ncbi:hypothetical protein EJ04DRAFT_250961 [Polyplosphaeria fusca]|uniref:BZIP domain-containing protein n=1 Tax=Polyplosphaeria fusca TaxID=682080 RepID=A0A9P4R0D0_9PLEO|nr:hypothetical protein EJ04DRAFT_250961 [Polyplosphaeria fusca]